MSFLRLHKLCSYLLAMTGAFALLLSGELHPLSWGVCAIAFAVSWRFEPPDIAASAYRLRWTQMTVGGCLLGIVVGITGIFPNPILLGAYLLLLLQINKIFNRLESKDYLHLYILSFLMLTLGTILNTDLAYAICFLLYVVFVTWTLTLFHLRREIEDTYLMRHSEEMREGEKVDVEQILQSKRLVRGTFLFSTSLIALTIFAMSSVLFFLFPRIGFGLFFHRQRSGIQTSGFSNEVKLGSFRRIQLNRKVVLRVELPEQTGKKPLHLPYYWRGSSFDLYDGQGWKRSRRYYYLLRFWYPDRFDIDSVPAILAKHSVYQVIYQEPLDVPILFGIDRVFKVQLPLSIPGMVRRVVPRVSVDLFSDTLTYNRFGAQSSSIRYMVTSIPDMQRPVRTRRRVFERHAKNLFLQLPPKLNPKIPALARRIIGRRKDAETKALAIVDYLQRNYQYSLVRDPFTGPPLDDFLFKQKRGHCEFFSTALAILLRSVGIPARQVTGFHGASWNPYGEYYAVRQSDAHAWVEILLPDKGWMRLDASPRANPSNQSSVWSKFEAYSDALRLRWYKWVIEYDLTHQLDFLRALRERVAMAADAMSSPGSRSTSQQLQNFLVWILVLVGVGIWVTIFLWRRKRHQKGKVVTLSMASQLYLDAVTLLGDIGMPRLDSETPAEYLERLQKAHPTLIEPMQTLTQVYIHLRYDPQAAAGYHIQMLFDALAQVRQWVRSFRDNQEGKPHASSR